MRKYLKYFKKGIVFKVLRAVTLMASFVIIVNTVPSLYVKASKEEQAPQMIFAFSMVAIYIVIKKLLLSRPRHFFKKARIEKSVQDLINNTIGPAPWYWNTFPSITGNLKSRFAWSFPGYKGKYSYLVFLSVQNEENNLKVALNTYTRAFLLGPHHLGLWHYENKQIHLLCFDPEKMPTFKPEELPLDFKNSKKSYYTLANPVCEYVIPGTLAAGCHTLNFPKEFDSLDELLLVTPYKTEGAAYALFELHPKDGELKVMPQEWFTREKFDLGYQWIARINRDPETGKFYGDGIRIGIFELTDDGCHLERWIGVS